MISRAGIDLLMNRRHFLSRSAGGLGGIALASLMAYSGYDVTREYYINDAGGQIDVLAQSAFLRYREALGEVIEGDGVEFFGNLL